MVEKLKGKFLPKDYRLNLFKKLQILWQKKISVKDFIEELYRFTIRVGHIKDDTKKVAIYLNELRYNIQDEINLLCSRTVEEAYQYSLKVEEKVSMKKMQISRGKIQSFRGRGSQSGRG